MVEVNKADEKQYVNKKHLLTYNLEDQIEHAMLVSKLAYSVGKELDLDEKMCQALFDAGQVHDIGKEELASYIDEGKDSLLVEEMRYVRMHPKKGHEILKQRGYSQLILESVLHHHENMDGSGYPDSLSGEDIPYGARILRVCDVFSALVADRPYRKAFDKQTAVELMIDEIKNFDIKVFLAFQSVVHEGKYEEVVFSR